MADYDEETGIKAEYDIFIEAIEVHFDCNWTPGSSVSFHRYSFSGMERLFRRKRCPKAFRWKPRQPRRIWGDVVIECAKDGCERNDVVVTEAEMWEMAGRAEYDSQGNAHIEIKNVFAFGKSTSILKVHRIKYYCNSLLRMTVAVEFGTSEECFRFIQHDIHELRLRPKKPKADDDADTVLDDVCKTFDRVAIDYRHAELAAIHRGLSCDDFNDEFNPRVTQVTRHQASPANNHAHPCVLMLHLKVLSTPSVTRQNFSIIAGHWSATDSLPTYPSAPNPFQNLNSFHFSSPASTARSQNSSLPPHSDTLSITFSDQGITFLDGTNSVSAVNGLTVSRGNATVVINYNRINTMADGYFGAISYSNIAGSNNTNIIHR